MLDKIKHLEEQLQNVTKEKELILKALDVLDVGIHIIDKKGYTTVYSKYCQEFEQSTQESVLGKHITEAYNLDENNSIQLKVVKTGIPIKNHHTTYTSPNGKTINIITDTYPIFENNEVIAAVSLNRDITDVKKLTEKVISLQKDLYNKQKGQNKNGTQFSFEDIICASKNMQETIETAKKIAVNLSPVLIHGETGTGKELFAQSIHNYSPVSKGPFVAINCGAIPETLLEGTLFGTCKGAFTGAEEKPGLFEEAQDGTLFLDEVNSTSPLLQAKLLRVLQTNRVRRVGGSKEIPVRVRIISAINEDPLQAIIENRLRSDFYYRIAVVTLNIPPLRKQLEGIPILTKYFITKFNKIMGKKVEGISQDVFNIFKKYNWPGNIRELEHTIEHAMNIIEQNDLLLQPEHLPSHFTNKFKHKSFYKVTRTSDIKETLDQVEKNIITSELDKNNSNITQTAKNLNISRQHLQYRMKRLGIKVKKGR